MDLLAGSFLLRPYVFLFLGAFLVVGARDLGFLRTLLFGAIVWPIAWVAEFASTRVGIPFGLYHYTGLTRGRELYLADAPFFDSLSFTFLAYAAFCLARCTRRGASPPFRRSALASGSLVAASPQDSIAPAKPALGQPPPFATAVLAGFFMMMLDVVIDPVAVRGERWFLGHVFYYAEPGVYFGVPLSNFAGWWLVGTVGVAAYGACSRLAGPGRPGRVGAGIALYYAVLGFNLAVTVWIGEWGSLAVGSVLHAAMTFALVAMVRRAQVRGVPRTGGVQRA